MGPWPGLEPGPAGPQPTVLTATLPQPYVAIRAADHISRVPRGATQNLETNGLKRRCLPLLIDGSGRRSEFGFDHPCFNCNSSPHDRRRHGHRIQKN